jgi:hypothetical protein
VPPLAAVPDLEHELDELYGLPLDEWTQARNDLAARLRKAHQSEQAEAVRALRKPSVVAWTVNQLARSEPRAMRDLLAAGDRLRSVQEDALRGRGGATEVQRATAAERDAVRRLVAAARELHAGRATQQTLDRVSQTLRAAAVDPQARPLLERGRIDEELTGAGFGSLTAVQPRARPRTDELKAERERVKELRARARELAREAREAETEADRLGREAARAREAADAKRAEADKVATELADAEEALRPRR